MDLKNKKLFHIEYNNRKNTHLIRNKLLMMIY